MSKPRSTLYGLHIMSWGPTYLSYRRRLFTNCYQMCTKTLWPGYSLTSYAQGRKSGSSLRISWRSSTGKHRSAETSGVTSELQRECWRAKRAFLKTAIKEEYWRGISFVNPSQPPQTRIQNSNGQIVASSLLTFLQHMTELCSSHVPVHQLSLTARRFLALRRELKLTSVRRSSAVSRRK